LKIPPVPAQPVASRQRAIDVEPVVTRKRPPVRYATVPTTDIESASGYSGAVALLGDVQLADAWPVSEQMGCPECGSRSLVASGVYEHGTWIYRLTCWTCRDCQTIVAFRESEAAALDAEAMKLEP
jgi:hypothetical protein